MSYKTIVEINNEHERELLDSGKMTENDARLSELNRKEFKDSLYEYIKYVMRENKGLSNNIAEPKSRYISKIKLDSGKLGVQFYKIFISEADELKTEIGSCSITRKTDWHLLEITI